MADHFNILDQGASSGHLYTDKITTGDVVVSAHVSWTVVTGITWSVPASAGQVALVDVRGMLKWASVGSDYFVLAVVNGSGTILLRSDSDTNLATVANEGDPGLYPASSVLLRTTGGPWPVTVTSDLLTAGNITLALASRGDGGATVFASTGYPWRWTVDVRSS